MPPVNIAMARETISQVLRTQGFFAAAYATHAGRVYLHDPDAIAEEWRTYIESGGNRFRDTYGERWMDPPWFLPPPSAAAAALNAPNPKRNNAA